MKRINVAFLFGVFTMGVLNSNCNSRTAEVLDQEITESIVLTEIFPEINHTANSDEIRSISESVITEIDKALPNLKKVEKKLTFFDIAETPITIWYSDSDLPVKIEHSVTNDSGEFSGKFQYYFIKGQLWYSDQIFARYLFDSDHLIRWMDENWRESEDNPQALKAREEVIMSNVGKLLNHN
jgi:hypothetical protein